MALTKRIQAVLVFDYNKISEISVEDLEFIEKYLLSKLEACTNLKILALGEIEEVSKDASHAT